MFLMLYSPLDKAVLLVLMQPSGDGYFRLCSSKSSFCGTDCVTLKTKYFETMKQLCPFKILQLKRWSDFISFLCAVTRENMAYIVNRAYKRRRIWSPRLSQLHSILQATSLRRTVYTRTKSATTTHEEQKALCYFSHWKLLLHKVYISNILCDVDWGYEFKMPIVKEAFR